METWVAGNWFELSQTVVLAAGLFATVRALRNDTKERKIENLFALTAAHREIWSVLYDRPQLNRILESNLDLVRHPITPEEELFVQFLILNLRTSFKARQNGMEFVGDDLGADIRDFFSQPIPRKVWSRLKTFQDPDFVRFVEANL